MDGKYTTQAGGRAPRAMLGLMAVAVVVAFVFAACGDDAGDTAGGERRTEIGIDLQEFAVVPAETSAPAGEVTFLIDNVGEETHEFVVIRTELGALDLPTEEDGSVSEAGEGMEVVDEVEDIPSGSSEELTVSLEAGHYVLICNIVEEEDGEHESHFAQGMRVDFEAE